MQLNLSVKQRKGMTTVLVRLVQLGTMPQTMNASNENKLSTFDQFNLEVGLVKLNNQPDYYKKCVYQKHTYTTIETELTCIV